MAKLTQDINRLKLQRYCMLVALPVLLTACEPDSQSLIDPSALFSPIAVATIDEDVAQEPATPVEPAEPITPTTPAPTEPADPTTPTPAPPAVVTPVNGTSDPLLVLTQGPINISMRFNNSTATIPDQFSFSALDYVEGSSGIPLLSTLDTIGPVVCSYVDSTEEYLCLRAYDLQVINRVWHLFTLNNGGSGTGVFESCDVNDTDDACSDKFLTDPDGVTTVSVGVNASIEPLPNAAPYLAYEEQGMASRTVINSAELPLEYQGVVKAIEGFAVGNQQ